MSENTLLSTVLQNSAYGYIKPRPNRRWLAYVAGAAVVTLTVLAFLLFRNERTFAGLEMHGGPVVIASYEYPEIVALTSHWEQQWLASDDNASSAVSWSYLHFDVWAFNASDLSRKWMTRVSTIKSGRRNLDEGILGVDNGTIWLIADGLIAIDANDGHVIADATKIEAKNAVLHGLMPNARRQILFDNGLVLIAADGKRWRIDPQTLAAASEPDVSKNILLGSGSGFYRPLRMSSTYHSFKMRSYVVGDTWYGMMHPSELAMFEKRDPYTQAFGKALRYKLWAAPIHDTLSRFRDPIREAHNWKPQPNSEEYLEGGLLAVPDSAGHDGVVGIAKPTRFLVIHQNRVEERAEQLLSCVGLDGRICWTAPLTLTMLNAFALIAKGGPASWAVIAVGETNREHKDKYLDPDRSSFPAFVRVGVSDGKVLRMSFESIDLAELSRTLKPYRKR
ncbi:MAG: PA2928 family protein [Gemmatimonadaceae bacterium]